MTEAVLTDEMEKKPNYVHRLIVGPLVASQEMAVELAMIALRYEYKEDCGAVTALTPVDRGEVWELYGTGMNIGGIPGRTKLIIRKFDGAFLDITVQIALKSS